MIGLSVRLSVKLGLYNPFVYMVIFSLSRASTTKMPDANNLALNETQSNSASYSDSSCLTLRQHVHQI